MSNGKRAFILAGAAVACGLISGVIGSATAYAGDLLADRDLPLFVMRVFFTTMIVAPLGALAGLVGGFLCVLLLSWGVEPKAPLWDLAASVVGVALGLGVAAVFFAMGLFRTDDGPALLTVAGVAAGGTTGLFIAAFGRRTRSLWHAGAPSGTGA